MNQKDKRPGSGAQIMDRLPIHLKVVRRNIGYKMFFVSEFAGWKRKASRNKPASGVLRMANLFRLSRAAGS